MYIICLLGNSMSGHFKYFLFRNCIAPIIDGCSLVLFNFWHCQANNSVYVANSLCLESIN